MYELSNSTSGRSEQDMAQHTSACHVNGFFKLVGKEKLAVEDFFAVKFHENSAPCQKVVLATL